MTAPVSSEHAVLARLSLLDRFLPAWILLAMALGLGLGRLFPGLNDALDTVKIGSVSLPIALGLLWMMYPVLAKVRTRGWARWPAPGSSSACRCCSTGSSGRP